MRAISHCRAHDDCKLAAVLSQELCSWLWSVLGHRFRSRINNTSQATRRLQEFSSVLVKVVSTCAALAVNEVSRNAQCTRTLDGCLKCESRATAYHARVLGSLTDRCTTLRYLHPHINPIFIYNIYHLLRSPSINNLHPP